MGIHPGEPKCTTFYMRHFFEHLQIACTKLFTAELMDVSGLWYLNKKSCSISWSLFGILEVKDRLDRTDKKNRLKWQKPYWNVAPDALPGSATIGLLA